MNRTLILAALAAATALAGSAEAAITVYTSQASFLAAISSPATDTFEDISINGRLPSQIVRTAGAYGYTGFAAQGFFGAGSTADRYLSTNSLEDSIVLNGFTGGVRGVGGLFFGTNVDGSFLASPSITLTAADASGSVTQSIASPTTTSFLGFVSTTGILSLTVLSPDTGLGDLRFPTINNLVLGGAPAAATPVPEPASWALMAVGVGLTGVALRRRRGVAPVAG